VRKRGFEAELQYKPSEKLHFTGNYTYIDAWQENEEIVPGVLVGRQAAFIPRYTMNLKLTYSLPKQYYATLEHISVSERLNYFQDSTVGAMRTGSLSPYSLLNLTLGKKIGREGENELYMVWDNITNQEYSLQFGGLQYNSTYTKSFWSRGYPMPLSSIRVGARLKF
jgi:outer membrane receptor protein involved in Fe transport